ncbi:MAG: DUF1883 domain-containing protein [Spirochaetales bacterium]|nr:DUF1883 domain-containing protein [Spirochaetales bacterium]
MNFLHYQIHAGPENIVQVRIDKRANVRLLDTLQYQKYRRGKTLEGAGGETDPPGREFRVQNRDVWHVIIDLGGKEGTVKAQVNVLRM